MSKLKIVKQNVQRYNYTYDGCYPWKIMASDKD